MISVLLKTGMGLFEILKLYFPIKQTFIKIASVFFIEKPTLPFYLVYILRLKSVFFHNSYILWLWESLKKDIFITMSFLLTLWISFSIHLQCEKGFAFMHEKGIEHYNQRSHLLSLNFLSLFNAFWMQKFFWRIRDSLAMILLFKSKYLFSNFQALVWA